jgi:leucyl-tRNA synthetase
MEHEYDVHEIEAKWRARWQAEGTGLVDLDTVEERDVFVNLVEFPYPSAEGLHVGHVFRYSGVDVYGRYMRMRGRCVFQPIGFDAFGIHTENYALRVNEHPAVLTRKTTTRFAEQLTRAGMAWDWSRVIDTSRPDYYRWTQWVLTRLFDAGLMYQAEAPVVWCPSCLTVLAREQTERDGTVCERCDTPVTERSMKQWFLRITNFADRLLDGLDGLDWPERAKRLQRQWIGRSEQGASIGRPVVRYRLRDWLISRQRYWGPPIPIVHCPHCGPVAVPDDQLPVLLPHIDDFRPTGTGKSPLTQAQEWVDVECPQCGTSAQRETDVSDTFVDSAWYFLRYPSTEFQDRAWDFERTARILPVDFYAGGPEHVQRHHLYARFVTMALHDLGLVPFEEPFPRIRLGGMIVRHGAKMSKSRGNVVTPDDYIEAHGADVLRCALLFSAPWEQGGDFAEDGIVGVERFFARVRRVITGADGPAADSSQMARTITDVTDAIERHTFNVGLARLMELLPSVRSSGDKSVFVRLLAPFAPHLAEELWHRLGEAFSVHTQTWPTADLDALENQQVEIVVQVDGRVRGTIRVPDDASESAVTDQARHEFSVLSDLDYDRVVFVPNRVVNFVSRTPDR